MRLKNSIYNTVLLIMQQVITAVYGLIVPALIIKQYGSSVNGTISSITQFLSYITLLESGVGGVIGAAMYKPLAAKDNAKLSGIVSATNDFFKKLAGIFLIYLFLVIIIYPNFVKKEFSWLFTVSLIIIISISTFAQYYFGITYQLLLQADQKSWVVAGIQIFSTIGVLFISIICIKCRLPIHLLKIFCTIVYVLRPILMRLYVERHYTLDNKAVSDKQALSQRWDGLAHHIAYIIHYNTDITVLTIFTNVLEVSVYAVYYNIISNIYKIISSVKQGISASVGNMIARGEKDLLIRTLNEFETLNFMLINIFYSCVAILIIPFISIYTKGVSDVNYIRPLFAILLILTEAAYGLREPYDMVIFAAGHFKQTKKGAYIEATLNVVTSVILVQKLGIVGVAIGSLVAMCFRVIQYVNYLSKDIVYRPIGIFIRKLFINVVISLCIYSGSKFIKINLSGYFEWFIYALVIFCFISLINVGVNFLVYRNDICGIINHFRKSK